MLRQTPRQHFEAAAAVTSAGDHDLAVHRNAPLVLDRGDEPGGVRVDRMRGDGKAEFRWADRRHFAPIRPGVLRAEDSIVVLTPHDLGVRGAAGQPMDVLEDRVIALLRRHILGIHAAVDQPPRAPSIRACPYARSRYADADVGGVARIDQHRVDAGLLAARDARPLPALGHMPQCLVQRPGRAAVVGAEEPARHRACPEAPRCPARLEHPDLAQRPGMRIFPGLLRLWREHRDRHLAPRPGAVAVPQLGSEMAEIERRPERAFGIRQHRGDRISEEPDIDDFPDAVVARQLEKTLAGPDMQPIRHTSPPLTTR